MELPDVAVWSHPRAALLDLFGNFNVGNLAKLVLPNFGILFYDTALSPHSQGRYHETRTLATRFCPK